MANLRFPLRPGLFAAVFATALLLCPQPKQAQPKHAPVAHGTDTIGLYDPVTSTFYLKNSNSAGPADLTFVYGPAGSGWIPIAGDWDGDGVDTIGLYDPAHTTFYLRNSNSAGVADLTFVYGTIDRPNRQVVTGDWNGDGIDTIGLNFDGSFFFLRNSNSAGPADITFDAYSECCLDIAGDWDGDRVATVGRYDRFAGEIRLKFTNADGHANLVYRYGPTNTDWKAVTGDWNGDGIDTAGLFDPSRNLFFLRNSNTAGVADLTFQYGPVGSGWIPIAGNWDGQ